VIRRPEGDYKLSAPFLYSDKIILVFTPRLLEIIQLAPRRDTQWGLTSNSAEAD